jgi:uncharacterized delta-60 repeat protein
MRPRARAALAAAIGTAAIALPAGAGAKPADLDSTFGDHGRVQVNGGGFDIGIGIAVAPGGKLVGAGHSNGENGLVFRLGPNGAPDRLFDTDGQRLVDSGADEVLSDTVAQPDGKIVVAGWTSANHDAVVYRLLPSGELDKSFGTGGEATIDSGATESATSVALQPDGKIVVAGQTTAGGGDAAVYRLTKEGKPDNSFGGDGAVGLDAAGIEAATGVAVAPDGKVVVAGYTTDHFDAKVWRLNENGTPDKTFNSGGERGLDLQHVERFTDVAVQPDGKVVLAGDESEGQNGLLVRFTKEGNPDDGFGDHSIVQADLGGDESIEDVAVQPDGKIVAAGNTTVGYDPFVARLTASGTPDSSFAPGGVTKIPGPGVDTLFGMTLQPDRKIALIGMNSAADRDVLVWRLIGDYRPSTDPGPAGKGARCAGLPATIVGTPKRDTIRGTARRDVIVARGGADRISALGAGDVVCAGGGDDVVRGGPGRDVLLGGPGRDTLNGGPGRDRLIGGPGLDKVRQ